MAQANAHLHEDHIALDKSLNPGHHYHDEKEVVPGQGIEVVPGEGPEVLQPNPPLSPVLRQRKRKMIIAAIIGALVAIAVIIGAVVGTKASKGSKASLPTATSSVPTTTTTPVPKSTATSRSVATAKWSDADGTKKLRLYYLDSSGNVMEATNSTDGTWDHRQLDFQAGSSSSIAVAVSQPNYPLKFDTSVSPLPESPPNYPLVRKHSLSPSL